MLSRGVAAAVVMTKAAVAIDKYLMSAGSCANVHSLGLRDCAENLTRDEMRNLDRDLTPGEEEELRNFSGMTDATLNSTAKPDPPICLAIIGPGGVGKSATTKGLRTDLNLSHGVLLDGDQYREVHEGYKAAVAKGLASSPPCIYPAVFEVLRK